MAKPPRHGSSRLSPHYGSHSVDNDPIERSGSVPMPSVGEEGMEYSAVADELEEEKGKSSSTAPEQTSTVAADLKLHAPKPSLPASSAIQRVAAVTRTDSDKAASFGIGRGHGEDRAVSREGAKKRSSTSLSNTSDPGQQTDDEHGIPVHGQRVPMNPHLGDVQAPSPGPSEGGGKHHKRQNSSRGLPPGSYGLHGHGVTPQDKLEKAYYQKHPDAFYREEHTPIHDRQNDFAMSKEDLNKLVRDTAGRAAGFGTTPEFRGTPTDEVAFQASDEYATRMSSRPASRARMSGEHRRSADLHKTLSNNSHLDASDSAPVKEEEEEADDDEAIHVDDPKHPEYRSYGDEEPAADGEDHEYHAPILAADEVERNPSVYAQRPAVHPPPHSYEHDDPPTRPTSRPSSLHQTNSQVEVYMTPLEDVEEYEPLFPEEAKNEKQKVEHADENKHHNHFPSKDIWEDAPNSVHYTAMVSTPDLAEGEHHRARSSGHHEDRAMTPAHLFAKQQEELAEKESKRESARHPPASFMPLTEDKKPRTWAGHQAHLKVERPSSGPSFPSRDIWEDVPESQLQQTTITPSPEDEEDTKPDIPSRPVKKSSTDSSDKPAVPGRPKPRQSSEDDKARPPVSDKPKPQIPSRPVKATSGDSKDEEGTKTKPPVPKRMGGKIAALQAGFMNDLNQRLQLGPQGPKKEEQPEPEAAEEEKEKAPLTDARKGRARGPQRRAPAKSPAAVSEAPQQSVPALTFSMSQSTWSIRPEDGDVVVNGEDEVEQPLVQEEKVAETVAEPETESALPAEPVDKEIKKEIEDETPEVAEEPVKEEKTLVANTAGESILETTVEKKDDGNEVEPLSVADEVN